jgi:hypothetical protein
VVPFSLSIAAMALISWMRARSKAVETALNWPNLESIVYVFKKPSFSTRY